MTADKIKPNEKTCLKNSRKEVVRKVPTNNGKPRMYQYSLRITDEAKIKIDQLAFKSSMSVHKWAGVVAENALKNGIVCKVCLMPKGESVQTIRSSDRKSKRNLTVSISDPVELKRLSRDGGDIPVSEESWILGVINEAIANGTIFGPPKIVYEILPTE